MSDFSTLCPLFNTGMYSEMSIYPGTLTMTSLPASTTTKLAGIPFSRSVIVTHAYLAKITTPASTTANATVKLYRAASWAATATVFASCKVSKSVTTQAINKYIAFTIASAKTFSATQYLIMRSTVGTARAKTVRNIVVRYKEK